jgi:hypothetical protein
MPDTLSGWFMLYPILIVDLALPRDGAQRHRCPATAREPGTIGDESLRPRARTSELATILESA